METWAPIKQEKDKLQERLNNAANFFREQKAKIEALTKENEELKNEKKEITLDSSEEILKENNELKVKLQNSNEAYEELRKKYQELKELNDGDLKRYNELEDNYEGLQNKYQELEKMLQYLPNYLMTTQQFLSRLITILKCENNAFIIPIY